MAGQLTTLYQNQIWKLHGLPKKIISDRDHISIFTSTSSRRLCGKFDQGMRSSSREHRTKLEEHDPFAEDFLYSDIYSMLVSDLLHQVIKGVFKDHLVSWIKEYITEVGPWSTKKVKKIMSEIDFWISLAPPFKSLWCFPCGHSFKQWTDDNSKVLIKIKGHSLNNEGSPISYNFTFKIMEKVATRVEADSETADTVDIDNAPANS
ncbi:hypothetical protein AN958_08745 [Leucoagaricus sp. SymC.cos]|nr:hypothetical protein AN958_08745 [Leucoagaricus sp. SymC.cos]